MDGLILMHMDEMGVYLSGGESYERKIGELIEQAFHDGRRVYNLPDWENPAKFLEAYDKIVTVDYRVKGNFRIQFFDCKKRMVDDGIVSTQICGWNIEDCILQMVHLLNGENEFHMKASDLDWTDEDFQRVLRHKIPARILFKYSR